MIILFQTNETMFSSEIVSISSVLARHICFHESNYIIGSMRCATAILLNDVRNHCRTFHAPSIPAMASQQPWL